MACAPWCSLVAFLGLALDHGFAGVSVVKPCAIKHLGANAPKPGCWESPPSRLVRAEKLDKNSSYLYVANHRDIVLDSAIMAAVSPSAGPITIIGR